MSAPGTEEVRAQLRELASLATAVSDQLGEGIVELADLVFRTLAGGGKLLLCGNGGSAADAQHLAAEYVVRMARDRAPLAAIALTTDTSILTAVSNDRSFDHVFERQVRALASPGDLLLLHSTSGESENLIRAAGAAREAGVGTAALLARGGGRLAALVDLPLVVPTDVTSRAQELHLAVGHVVCAIVERRILEGA